MVFILVSVLDASSADWIGETQIIVVNDDGGQTVVKTNIYDSGFYQLD